MSDSISIPFSQEAEERLLACCLLDGTDVLAKCAEGKITPESFYQREHALIFDRLLDMVAKQMPIEVSTLAEELKTAKQFDEIGGYAFIAQVTQSVPTTVEAAYFIEKVRDLARLRTLISLSEGIKAECHAFTGDWSGLKKRVERVSEAFNGQTEARSWALAVKEAEALTRERMRPPAERNTGHREISWGIPDFDRYFQPIEPGELIIIGGYTSSGKSSLLRQIAWNIAAAGLPSLIETIEVRDTEEAINLAAHISGFRSRARLHELHRKDQETLLATFETMRRAPFSVGHQDTSWSAMAARARAYKRKFGLKFLGADYLQIMDEVKKLERGTRPDFAIGVVTSDAKKFATNEDTAVCLLSGFNREYIKGNREPILSDLEGSSNIEKDASRVLLIHVPTEYRLNGTLYTQSPTADPEDQPSFFVKIIQAKGRNQGTASVGMMFHRESKTFRQITR